MGRRTGFVGILEAAARQAAREARQAETAAHRARREAEREARRQEKIDAAAARDERLRYLETRQQEADDRNAALAEQIEALEGILSHTLTVNDSIDFDTLRIREGGPALQVPAELARPIAPPKGDLFIVPAPRLWARLLPWRRKRYWRELAEAQAALEKAQAEAQHAESERRDRLARLTREHERARAAFQRKVAEREAEVADFQAAYEAGEEHAIVTYNSMVLERSDYPQGFPQNFRLAFSASSCELIAEYELPSISIVPATAEYRFNKSKDLLDEKPRRATEVKALYADVVSAVALRTLHEVFEADSGNHVAVVTFNGFVQTVDPCTGKDVKPHLVSVRATKDRFLELDLSRVERKLCLRNLGAQVSPRPEELQPVKPIVDFCMVDKRFVDGSDVIAGLDSRPNLMDLSPFEFEHLVGNLFCRMGLETRQTQASRDGGVDVVAYDTRPVLGGKVVIQAKRYRHTVGVSAVRDLFGTMMNEGANKGILVSTSGYGRDAFDFAKDKPIELIDGGGLLYLLENHADTRARIVMPAETQQ